MRSILFLCCLLIQYCAVAQYAPQAGLAGSTAISAGSPAITGWANTCSVQRGYIDIANTTLGTVTGGESANATGSADGYIVCLGDSGVATLRFDAALYDGPGPDFAVFENGFTDPANPEMAFLELAFAEVSSDGINYFRFPANSNTGTNTQIPGSGVYMDASLINNLAGKYVATYGTPFDLQEMAGQAGLDINNVTHVRLVDVVGSLSGHQSKDVAGKTINDPYPTNFASGGFDLDAVAALHQVSAGTSLVFAEVAASVYPNPASDLVTITINKAARNGLTLIARSITGTVMGTTAITETSATLNIANYPAGLYYLTVTEANETIWAGKIAKY